MLISVFLFALVRNTPPRMMDLDRSGGLYQHVTVRRTVRKYQGGEEHKGRVLSDHLSYCSVLAQ